MLYDILGEDQNGRLIGNHRSTGVGRPAFWERARYYGVEEQTGDCPRCHGDDGLGGFDAARIRRANTMDPLDLILVALIAVSAGGVAYALLYPSLSGDKRAEERQRALTEARLRSAH